jgi:hypothetical protein
MKLLSRLALTVVTGGLVATAGSVPASAVVDGRDATRSFQGQVTLSTP